MSNQSSNFQGEKRTSRDRVQNQLYNQIINFDLVTCADHIDYLSVIQSEFSLWTLTVTNKLGFQSNKPMFYMHLGTKDFLCRSNYLDFSWVKLDLKIIQQPFIITGKPGYS